MSEKSRQLRELLNAGGIFVVDGGMGTELVKIGVPAGAQAGATHPDAVESIHRAYIAAGSQAIITNTLTANRIYADTHGTQIDIARINRASAAAALRAAEGSPTYVLGDLGPTGQMLEPYGTYTRESVETSYREQVELLLEAGVDGIYIETMFDLQEALCAVRAARAASTELPILASLSFSTTQNGGRTMMGDGAVESARRIREEGADVFGLNCGDLSPMEFAEIVRAVAQASPGPIAVEPNAGKPRLEGDVTVYDMPPDEFAEGIRACVAAGARVIGGCCGTGPAHISAISGLSL